MARGIAILQQECFMGGKFGNLVNHQQFAKLKPSKLVVIINNVLANLASYSFAKLVLPKSLLSTFAKRYHHQTFPLYGMPY